MAKLTKERRVTGACSCGIRIVMLIDSELPTCRTDGTRYIYEGELDDGWGIFRCKRCHMPIDESFITDEALKESYTPVKATLGDGNLKVIVPVEEK